MPQKSRQPRQAESENAKLQGEAAKIYEQRTVSYAENYLKTHEPEQYKLFTLGRLVDKDSNWSAPGSAAETYAKKEGVLEHFAAAVANKVAEEANSAAEGQDFAKASKLFGEAGVKFTEAATLALDKARTTTEDKVALQSAKMVIELTQASEQCAGAVKQLAAMQAQASQQANALGDAVESSLSQLRSEREKKG